MRRIIALFASVAFLFTAQTGCEKKTTPGGGPKAAVSNPSSNAPGMISLAPDTFQLDVPTLSTTLQQGASKTIDISINRGKDFQQEVGLVFTDPLPKGVTVEPAAPMIKSSEKMTQLTFKAADDAALGDHTIHVKGHPMPSGTDSSPSEFKISVTKK